MYVYIQTEPGLWTVGFYSPDGKFHSGKEISKFLGIPYKLVPKVLKRILDPSINLENVIGYSISGSTTGKIKFTSAGIDTHIIQIIARYTSG